jgi:hypothetical protein
MGLGTWLMKNGPGSPGQTTRVLIDLYNKLEKHVTRPSNHDKLMAIYEERQFLASKFNNKTALFSNYHFDQWCPSLGGDFSLFVFLILCLETSQFRNSLIGERSAIETALKVIREEVQKKSPSLIALDEVEYIKRGWAIITKFY